LSLLNQTNPPGKGAPYAISPGIQLWQAYVELYKRYGVTLGSWDPVLDADRSTCACRYRRGGASSLAGRIADESADQHRSPP
jgi:hypothetical protein